MCEILHVVSGWLAVEGARNDRDVYGIDVFGSNNRGIRNFHSKAHNVLINATGKDIIQANSISYKQELT